MKTTISVLACALLAGASAAGGTDWVMFADETAIRLQVDPALGAEDPDEKDYAWGDVDGDGDVDLVCVRKEGWTSAGKRPNVLLLNEGGVLVDRTAEHAAQSDVPGDQGFLTPTNDRDVALVDVTGDGWLDIVTVTTISDGDPKHVGHPRIYVNLGESDGVWQGFRHEDARIPQLFTTAGLAVNPRFCSVAAGDIDGDGDADLYFGDYDASGAGGVQQDPSLDLDDRLLVNTGVHSGVFADQSAARMTGEMLESAFGMAVAIEDMNGDGLVDIVKDTALNFPQRVSISYNDAGAPGTFDAFDIAPNSAPYHISVGELNNDGKLDIVVTDDGADRYLVNQGNGEDGLADFLSFTFSFTSPGAGDDGFGGNSVIADLNNDGFDDVVLTDVDVDIPGCNRRTWLYRNLGGPAGANVTLQEQGLAGLPEDALRGVHDVAVLDLDGDGWLDLVLGTCSGTTVWMNQPPNGLVFTYPDGLPAYVPPGAPHEFDVQLAGLEGAEPAPGSASLFASVNGGPFAETILPSVGPDRYRATLPAGACVDRIRFYVRGELSDGGIFTDPPAADLAPYATTVADGTAIELLEDFEGAVDAWTVVSDPSLASGAWEAVDPTGTITVGNLAAPEDDFNQLAGQVIAFVTEDGLPGGGAGDADVDGGPTHLISPRFDLAGRDAVISYARWFYCSEAGLAGREDFLTVWLSGDDGATWVPVPEHTTGGTGSAWETVSLVVSGTVTPTDAVRIRFTTEDHLAAPGSSITEAGIDNVQLEVFVCADEEICPENCVDLKGAPGLVDVTDLLVALDQWGEPGGCDVNGDGVVDIMDVLAILVAWGPCAAP